MRSFCIGLLIVTGAALAPNNSRADELDMQAMSTATRELGRQMNYFQEFFGTNDRLLQINGLFKQTMEFQNAMSDFRQSVRNKASREQLAIAFDPIDRQLTAILDEVGDVARDDAGFKMVCRRLRSAESDLHFAVFSSDASPTRQSERLYRQTLGAQAMVEGLANNIAWVFSGRDSLQGWKDDVGAVQQTLMALQALEKKKATQAELNAQFASVEKTWSKVVDRYQAARDNKLLLQGFVVPVDQGFSRIATLVGVKDRRAPLTDGLSD